MSGEVAYALIDNPLALVFLIVILLIATVGVIAWAMRQTTTNWVGIIVGIILFLFTLEAIFEFVGWTGPIGYLSSLATGG